MTQTRRTYSASFAVKFWTVIMLATCLAFGNPSASRADDKEAAKQFANNLGTQAMGVITDGTLAKDAKRQKLEGLFEENVDINWIGKFVLGRYWRDASEEQKQQYLGNYKVFLIKHYTSNLTEFTDANFEVTKVEPEDRGGYVVTMNLKRPNAEDTVVSYTVRKNEAGKLNVYDLVVEGVSMITTQRSEFNSVVSQKGLDYLITELGNRGKAAADKN